MIQATTTIPDELTRELKRQARRQEGSPELSAVVQRVLRDFLRRREGVEECEFRPFRVTPVDLGSGGSDVSINHDKYVANDACEDAFSRRRGKS